MGPDCPYVHHRTTMSSSKKRKNSGLSGLELELTLTQLCSSLIIEKVPGSDPTPADTFMDELDRMIITLESRASEVLQAR